MSSLKGQDHLFKFHKSLSILVLFFYEDAYIWVLCHELGHHIGGAPKKRELFGRKSWSSSEGQADYWASLKCMRRLYLNPLAGFFKEGEEVPEIVQKKCSQVFSESDQVNICIRSSMAGLSHSQFLNRQNHAISFETPDPKKVRKTNDKHPKPQCRLDTAFAGSLCPIAYQTRVRGKDAKVGTCTQGVGKRPACWF